MSFSVKGSSKKKHLSRTFWELLILFVACPSFEILSLSPSMPEKKWTLHPPQKNFIIPISLSFYRANQSTSEMEMFVLGGRVLSVVSVYHEATIHFMITTQITDAQNAL